MEIELITKKVKVNGVYPESRTLYLDKNKYKLLYFCDTIDEEVIYNLKEFLNINVSIIVITPHNSIPFIDKDVKFIFTENEKWYIHTLFLDPFVFKAVTYYGNKAKILAETFSQFTGFKIDIINSIKELCVLILNCKKSVLIKIVNGIGDLLMCTPIAKYFYSKGYKVSFYISQSRVPVFYNLDYVDKVFSNNTQINISLYKYFFDLSYKISHYNKKICQQHRINVIADYYNVPKEEIELRPEIKLKSNEILKSYKFIESIDKNKKMLLIALDSVDIRRAYPYYLRGGLIKLLYPFFNIVLVGNRRADYKYGINLTGVTSIREMFGLVFLSDLVLTVDTSILHVAGAFDKKTILLPSTINHKWRDYKNVITIQPECKCYPCNEYIDKNSLCNKGLSCLSTIDQNKILNSLLKLKEEIDEKKKKSLSFMR